MAVNSRASTEVFVTRKWQQRESSPERAKIWIQPNPNPNTDAKVPVLYYLSRNGHLEHPHFMEVSLSAPEGLYLRDVMNRLNFLRGEGMASMYSWSSKRSFRNGFVWRDLSKNDLIYPTQGREYVLKGSQLLQTSLSFRHYETRGSSEKVPETSIPGDFPVRRRNQSWSSFDPHEYKIYEAESSREFAGKTSDAATQTEDIRRRRRGEREERERTCNEESRDIVTEFGRDGIPPRPSNSNAEGPEGSGDVDRSALLRDQTVESQHRSGRKKASRVLKQLISCGSVTVNASESTKCKGR